MFGIFHSFFADFQRLFLISAQKAYFIALFSLTFVSKSDIFYLNKDGEKDPFFRVKLSPKKEGSSIVKIWNEREQKGD